MMPPIANPTTQSTRNPVTRKASLDVGAARRRLGLALAGEEQPAHGGEREGGRDSDSGVTGRGQEGHQDRPDDERELVQDRFEGQRGRQFRGALEQVCPPGTQHAGHRWDAGTGNPGSHEHDPERLIFANRPEKRRTGDEEHGQDRM